MLSNVGPLRTLSYSMLSTVSAGGRTSVPVKPSQYVYSQFQYVSGVPAQTGQSGISIDKLKILNTLIDHLVTMKGKNAQPQFPDSSSLSTEQIDALIKQYQTEIKTTTAAAENLLYKPQMPQTGAVFSLVA
ncbi:MAG TPA: hypothetical protein PLU93_06605 [Treponemataceae bacterium]|nr:hypothetical protein [Treponemataceae bacterium]